MDGTDFIAGRFESPASPDGELEHRSPADTSQVVMVARYSRHQVDRAVEAARGAFPGWRRTSRDGRAAVLERYREGLARSAEALAGTISREIGKPRWEARAEVSSMVNKVSLSLEEGLSRVRDEQLPGLPGEIRHRPHGVAAVVGPFNFPGHLPNGQLVPALLTGNTVVFKPSEKGMGTALFMARLLEEAGAPAGVFNVVQGGVAVAEHLVTHPGVDAVLFTGSVAVGQRILAANVHRPGLMVALELGGKNAAVVLDDADVERTVRELAFSAFATAGQRCTATSRVFATPGIAEQLGERLAAAARGAVVGHPDDEGVFMGPLISRATRDALLDAQARAVAGGFTALEPGGVATARTEGHYVRPAVHVAARPVRVPGYTDAELFAPDLSIVVVDGGEAAVAAANDSPFGLAASVYTASRDAFEACADGLEVGVVHWNRSSAGASGRLPFGGIKASGNHRPAGILMASSCVFPQAVLLPAPPGPLPEWPGLRF